MKQIKKKNSDSDFDKALAKAGNQRQKRLQTEESPAEKDELKQSEAWQRKNSGHSGKF